MYAVSGKGDLMNWSNTFNKTSHYTNKAIRNDICVKKLFPMYSNELLFIGINCLYPFSNCSIAHIGEHYKRRKRRYDF